MTRQKWMIGLGATVIVVGILVWWWVASGSVSTDDAQIDGHISAISARVSGNVIAVAVQDGQNVKTGDLLLKIDPRDYEVALAKAEADLADAEASLRGARLDVPLTATNTASQLASAQSGRADAGAGGFSAERQVAGATARLASAQARVKEAEANAAKAAQDLVRYKTLVDKDEISRQQYDAAVAAATATQAEAEGQKAALTEAVQNVSVAKSAVDQAKARVSQADASVRVAQTAPQQLEIKQAAAAGAAAQVAQKQALVDEAKLNLQYCTVTAPVDGVVGKKTVEVGQNVSPGQQLLAVVPLEDVWVTANFKETQLRKMQVGQRVTVAVDASGNDLKGVVDSIGAASGSRYSLLPPENATGNYVKVVQRIPVRIKLERGQDPEHRLRVGMSVVPKVYVR